MTISRPVFEPTRLNLYTVLLGMVCARARGGSVRFTLSGAAFRHLQIISVLSFEPRKQAWAEQLGKSYATDPDETLLTKPNTATETPLLSVAECGVREEKEYQSEGIQQVCKSDHFRQRTRNPCCTSRARRHRLCEMSNIRVMHHHRRRPSCACGKKKVIR